MTNPFTRLFRYTDTIRLNVPGDASQAAKRLSHAARTPIVKAAVSKPLERTLVGTASRDCVRLHEVTPFFGNIFKPIFVGRFELDQGRTVLLGRFEIGAVGRIVISIFVSFGLIVQIILLPLIGTEAGSGMIGIFEPTIFILGGILVVLAIKAYSKGQIPRVTQQIETALAAHDN
jgi:hypothetical protein